eukprot:c35572_g1_i1 orf=50-220(+)
MHLAAVFLKVSVKANKGHLLVQWEQWLKLELRKRFDWYGERHSRHVDTSMGLSIGT